MERLKRLGPWTCGVILLLGVGVQVAICAGMLWLQTRPPRGAYFAVVDHLEPAIPGLIVRTTRAVVGEIEVVNDTGQDVFIYDQEGTEYIKITSTGAFWQDERGQWNNRITLNNVVNLGYELDISYDAIPTAVPDGEYNGQVMKTWEVRGRVGDTPFTIYGRTVYYTRQPTPTPTPHTPTP